MQLCLICASKACFCHICRCVLKLLRLQFKAFKSHWGPTFTSFGGSTWLLMSLAGRTINELTDCVFGSPTCLLRTETSTGRRWTGRARARAPFSSLQLTRELGVSQWLSGFVTRCVPRRSSLSKSLSQRGPATTGTVPTGRQNRPTG